MLRLSAYRGRQHGCKGQREPLSTPGGTYGAGGHDREGGSGPFAIFCALCAGDRQPGRDLRLAWHVPRAASNSARRGARHCRGSGPAAGGPVPDQAGRAVLRGWAQATAPMSQLKSRPQLPGTRVLGIARLTRLVIVENHQLVSESLGLLLDGQKDMQVVGKASSVAEASELPASLMPDVVVMDYHLGDGTGRDAAMAMRATFPNVRFVFLSRDESDDARLAAVEAGASAYLHKSSPASDVIDTIRKVAAGMSLITPAMVARLVSRGHDREHMRDSLSPREREVLQLLADGIASRQIAQRLGISYSTV